MSPIHSGNSLRSYNKNPPAMPVDFYCGDGFPIIFVETTYILTKKQQAKAILSAFSKLYNSCI